MTASKLLRAAALDGCSTLAGRPLEVRLVTRQRRFTLQLRQFCEISVRSSPRTAQFSLACLSGRKRVKLGPEAVDGGGTARRRLDRTMSAPS